MIELNNMHILPVREGNIFIYYILLFRIKIIPVLSRALVMLLRTINNEQKCIWFLFNCDLLKLTVSFFTSATLASFVLFCCIKYLILNFKFIRQSPVDINYHIFTNSIQFSFVCCFCFFSLKLKLSVVYLLIFEFIVLCLFLFLLLLLLLLLLCVALFLKVLIIEQWRSIICIVFFFFLFSSIKSPFRDYWLKKQNKNDSHLYSIWW